MTDGETPDERHGGGEDGRPGAVMSFPVRGGPARGGTQAKAADGAVVSFDRGELRTIFNLYGRRVAEGEWRDYAIDFRPTKAVFSIYRRASEVPLFRVEKDPSLARRQGAYAVTTGSGTILKRGPDLERVLRVLESRPKLVVL